tara:strand:+ start:585 stop:857 length:273 start_codon:yes stop_codon:yes gene_type:complete
MGRQNQKKLCYSVLVKIGEHILHDNEYITLYDVARDLNLTYAQVADLSIGRSKKFESKFKYQPKIEIRKLSTIEHNGTEEEGEETGGEET